MISIDLPVTLEKRFWKEYMMVETLDKPSSEESFEFLKMFNYVVVLDKEFAARLPEAEFELSFSCEGNIYVNGKPLEVNVKERYEAAALK